MCHLTAIPRRDHINNCVMVSIGECGDVVCAMGGVSSEEPSFISTDHAGCVNTFRIHTKEFLPVKGDCLVDGMPITVEFSCDLSDGFAFADLLYTPACCARADTRMLGGETRMSNNPTFLLTIRVCTRQTVFTPHQTGGLIETEQVNESDTGPVFDSCVLMTGRAGVIKVFHRNNEAYTPVIIPSFFDTNVLDVH